MDEPRRLPIDPTKAYFIDTLDDLRRLTGFRVSDYSVTQLAGVLRRLLLDSTPLWTRVNREFRLDVRVRTAAILQLRASVPAERYWLAGFHLDPLAEKEFGHPDWEQTVGERDVSSFLKMRIALSAGEGETALTARGITVHALIKHYANSAGGVHFDGEPPADVFLCGGHS